MQKITWIPAKLLTDDAIQALVRSLKTAELLLVLGVKHLVKTFLKGAAIKRCNETERNIDIVLVDMRDCDMSGKPLLAALDLQRQTSLKWSTRAMEVLRAVIRDSVTFFGGKECSGAGAAKGVLDVVVQAKQMNIDNFINKTIRSGRIPSLIVDEANVALPGLDNIPNAAAKSALTAITKWTKQTNLASVMLISSDFDYPFRLLAGGLDLSTISKVIVIGEVPEVPMLKMLTDDWGMDTDLAEMFYNYFGGDTFTTKKAVDSLMEKKDNFDPFAVDVCPGLPSCVKNVAARAHLENIAKQGFFSLVEDVKTDEGAKMIAEENPGRGRQRGCHHLRFTHHLYRHRQEMGCHPIVLSHEAADCPRAPTNSLANRTVFYKLALLFFVILLGYTVPVPKRRLTEVE